MPSEIRVWLTWDEVAFAAQVGVVRNVQDLAKGCKPRAGQIAKNLWGDHAEGACGESATAKYLGEPWTGNIGDYLADDVGPYQVRTNCSRGYQDMILRPNDFEKKRIYVSVLCFLPEFIILGWAWNMDCKRDEWLKRPDPTRDPCYLVPRKFLHPMEELPVNV